ncbi:unnamed protein product, partial [Ectocarpus sp. 13 AM-2016]
LAKQYTCIAWHRPSSKKSKRGSSGASKSSSLGMIALGTDKGSVSVWDLKRGALAYSLGEGEGFPSITSVAFSADGSSLFTASSGKEVVEWNVETGTVARKLKGIKHGATKICLHPAGKILAIASSAIRLLDLTTGKTARKLSAGHAGSVRLLSFSADGRYLASSASSARFVNVFDVAASEVPPSEPVCTLGFAATPAFLSLHTASPTGGGGEASNDQVTVVAGFDTGGVSVMRTRRQSDGKGGAVSKLDIRGAAGGPSSSPSALHGRLSSERPSSAILLATGSAASPGFAEASFEDEAGSLLSSSSVAAAGGHADGDEGEEEGTGDKGGPAHVVGPGELGIRGVEKDSVVAGGGRGDKMEDAGGGEDGDGR